MLYLDHFQSGISDGCQERKLILLIRLPRHPDSPHGFILECDLSYPSHLHIDHNDLPLAPEKISVDPSDWSPYTSSAAETSGTPFKRGGKKLIPQLGQRKNYVLHYLNLKFYLGARNGFKRKFTEA